MGEDGRAPVSRGESVIHNTGIVDLGSPESSISKKNKREGKGLLASRKKLMDYVVRISLPSLMGGSPAKILSAACLSKGKPKKERKRDVRGREKRGTITIEEKHSVKQRQS